MEGGRLSPLRSPRQFDFVPRDQHVSSTPINDYAVKGLNQRKTAENRSQNGRAGHTKCYYEELSSVVRSRLADLLITVADEEQRIERQRQSLAALLAFEPYAAFSRIDRENKGWICGQEIKNYLSENHYHHLLESECNYIVKYIDSTPTEHQYPRLDYQE